jgi:hypothetical protein
LDSILGLQDDAPRISTRPSEYEGGKAVSPTHRRGTNLANLAGKKKCSRVHWKCAPCQGARCISLSLICFIFTTARTSNLVRITVSGHNYKGQVNSSFINKITSLNCPQTITMKRLKCGTHGMQRESGEGESRSLVPPGTDEGETEKGIRRKRRRGSGQHK